MHEKIRQCEEALAHHKSEILKQDPNFVFNEAPRPNESAIEKSTETLNWLDSLRVGYDLCLVQDGGIGISVTSNPRVVIQHFNNDTLSVDVLRENHRNDHFKVLDNQVKLYIKTVTV